MCRRSTILVKMSTGENESFSYEPGDHLGVFPTNDQQQVACVLSRLLPDVDFDVPFVVEECCVDEAGMKLHSLNDLNSVSYQQERLVCLRHIAAVTLPSCFFCASL